MRRKRTSLDVILGGTEAAPATRPPPEPPPSRRPLVKQQTVYLPLPVYEQLRRLAFEERRRMHELLMEGLDRVFRDRGLPDRAELQRRPPGG
jgi:hypothetical protein